MRSICRFYIAFLLFIFISEAVFAQSFPMLHFTKTDGLPSNNVYNIYKDKKGFLWVATDKGIARYNGIKFETFTTFNGLPDNEIFFSTEDYCGRLWLSTHNGALCYYKDGIFHTAANTPLLNLKTNNPHITLILNQKDSSVLFLFFMSNRFLDIKDDRCKVIDVRNLKPYDRICSVSKVNSNLYRIICPYKIIDIDSNGHITGMHQMPLADKQPIIRFGQNHPYAYSMSYVYTPDIRRVVCRNTDSIYDNAINDMLIGSSNLFFATNSGLYINGIFHILNDKAVSAIIQDIRKDYWVSTIGSGVFVLKNNFLETKKYNNCYNGKAKYALANGGKLYFSDDGNNLYELHNNRIQCLLHYKNLEKNNSRFTLNSAYYIDAESRYFSSYASLFMVVDNLNSNKITVDTVCLKIQPKKIFVVDRRVYTQQSMNVTGFDCNQLFYLKDKCIINYKKTPEKIFGFAKADDNTIWFSAISGIYKIVNYKDTAVLQNQFQHIAFKSFNFLGKYLIGYTHSNLLFVCKNFNSNRIKMVAVPEHDCIWDGFYKIDNRHMLLSTNNLYRLLTIDTNINARDTFTISTIEDPFMPTDAETICSDGAACYFFKNGAVISISVKSLLKQPVPPELFYAALKTNEQVYHIDSFLKIPYNQSKNINISFSTLSFYGQNVSYQYSVSQGNTDYWANIKSEEINLIHPDFGTHVMKVRAKTISSTYSNPITFTLYIQRPFWAAWWFIILSATAGTTFAILGIKYRVTYILKRKEKMHANEIKMLKLEYKALNALMNPHFVFNSLNNIQALINKDERLSANNYLGIFARLIRQNMHNISLEMISLQQEMDVVCDYLQLEKLRFKERLQYNINVAENIDMTEIMVPPLLIQPLVENAIKHGIFPGKVAGTIYIEISEENGFAVISVKDNGIGIDEAQKQIHKSHQSFGLENIRKRLSQLSALQEKQITLDICSIKNETGKHMWTIALIKIQLPEI